jgi:hypothetical protein
MIIIAIVSGIFVGWAIGNFLLDRWVNNGMEDINDEGQNPSDSGKDGDI